MRYTLDLQVLRGLALALRLGLSLCDRLVQGFRLDTQAIARAGVTATRLFVVVAASLMLTACRGGMPVNDPSVLGFVDIADFMERNARALEVDVRYFGSDNFVGARVDGYDAEKIYLTREAATALVSVQKNLHAQGLALKIFDAYRPQQAVDHFVRWAKDLEDVRMKANYYPRVNKENLFRDGYIASRSGHSRGSTVDLTLVTLADRVELDMGTTWDFFDPLSWPSSAQVTLLQRANRDLLAEVMTQAGFRPLKEEWWHFTLEDEPFPDRYFNFKIE